jgi:phosphatidylglycerol:prolipoprotein diacylglycerol transferase
MPFQMPLSAIAFPAIDPIIFSIGPVQLHWYGLSYIAGILFGLWYAKRLVTSKNLWPGEPPIKPASIDDFLIWAIVGIVLGGRLGYVLFYDLPTYLDNPLQIAMLWQGGMSFHGGLLGSILAMILFARKRGFSPYHLLDVIAACAPIGIMLGRIANFINQELFGKPTNLPWGVVFPSAGDGVPRHPSQLYEAALEGLILFLVLRFLTHHLKKLGAPGFVGGALLAGYAISRILVEFVRLPDPQLGYLAGGWLTMGMVLSLPVLAIGVWGMATAGNRKVAGEKTA